MTQRFVELYRAIHSPVPAAVELLQHVFVSPSTILEAPLSNPVIQRLQWIPPSLDDVNESYLYFNNMINQGASGRIHQLRLEMIHSGPSCWQVCQPSQVEYKVDENNIESNGLICEIFARVTVWKNEDGSQHEVDDQDKLGIILKLEADEQVGEGSEGGNLFKNRRLTWKYFDLQDLVTPGMDSRPWFQSLVEASNPRESEETTDDQADYWVGYSSSSEDEEPCSKRTTDAQLQAWIQNTPLPSVSSTNSTDAHHQSEPNLLARLSHTPLYKRAPSLADDDLPTQNPSALDHLLKAADIVNPPSCSRLVKTDFNSDQPASSKYPPIATSPPKGRTNLSIDAKKSIKELEDNLIDSLRSTFSFYKLSFDLLNRQRPPLEPKSLDGFSLAERFVTLAHRVARDQ